MTGGSAPSDRTECGTTRETAEIASGTPPVVIESAPPPGAHGCEPVAPPDLADDVLSALAKSKYNSLRRVVAATSVRSVLLGGSVPSYYLKQLAQTVVMAVPGVEGVRNELDVGVGR